MESATVDVKVDVARFEVGGRRLPHRHLGVQILDEAPGCIADALAMDFGVACRGGCSLLRQICNLTHNTLMIFNPKYNNCYPIAQKMQRNQSWLTLN